MSWTYSRAFRPKARSNRGCARILLTPAAKSDVASDEGGSAAVELATAKPGEQTEVIVGTNADLNC